MHLYDKHFTLQLPNHFAYLLVYNLFAQQQTHTVAFYFVACFLLEVVRVMQTPNAKHQLSCFKINSCIAALQKVIT